MTDITPTPNAKSFFVDLLDLDDKPITIEIPSDLVPELEIGPEFAHGVTSFVHSGMYQGKEVAIKITMGSLGESKWLGQFSDDDISPELYAHFELDISDLKITSKHEPILSKKLSLVVSEKMEMTLSEALFNHQEFVKAYTDKIVAEMKRFQKYFNRKGLSYGDTNTDNIVLNREPFKLRLVDFEDVFVIKDEKNLPFFTNRWNKAIESFLKIISKGRLSKKHKIFLDMYDQIDDLYKE